MPIRRTKKQIIEDKQKQLTTAKGFLDQAEKQLKEEINKKKPSKSKISSYENAIIKYKNNIDKLELEIKQREQQQEQKEEKQEEKEIKQMMKEFKKTPEFTQTQKKEQIQKLTNKYASQLLKNKKGVLTNTAYNLQRGKIEKALKERGVTDDELEKIKNKVNESVEKKIEEEKIEKPTEKQPTEKQKKMAEALKKRVEEKKIVEKKIEEPTEEPTVKKEPTEEPIEERIKKLLEDVPFEEVERKALKQSKTKETDYIRKIRQLEEENKRYKEDIQKRKQEAQARMDAFEEEIKKETGVYKGISQEILPKDPIKAMEEIQRLKQIYEDPQITRARKRRQKQEQEQRIAQIRHEKSQERIAKSKLRSHRMELERDSNLTDRQRYEKAKSLLRDVAESNNYLNSNAEKIIEIDGYEKWRRWMNDSDDELQKLNFTIQRYEAGITLENVNKPETLLQDYTETESELKDMNFDFTPTRGKFREELDTYDSEEEEDAVSDINSFLDTYKLKEEPREAKYKASTDYFDNREIRDDDYNYSSNRFDFFDQFEQDNKHNNEWEQKINQDNFLNEYKEYKNPESYENIQNEKIAKLEYLDRNLIEQLRSSDRMKLIDANPDDVYTISQYQTMFGSSDEDRKNERERHIDAITEFMNENKIAQENIDFNSMSNDKISDLATRLNLSNDVSTDTFDGIYGDALEVYNSIRQTGKIADFLDHPRVKNTYMGNALRNLDQEVATKDGKLNNLPSKFKSIMEAMAVPVKIMAGEADPRDVLTVAKAGIAVKDIVQGAYNVISGKRTHTEEKEETKTEDEKILESMRRLQERGDLPLQSKLQYPTSKPLKQWRFPETNEYYNAVPLIQNSITAYLNDQNLYGGGYTGDFQNEI